MEKSKSFDYMVTYLYTLGHTRRDVITGEADMTGLVESVLLKGYPISKGRKFYAKNLEPVAVV